MVHVCMFHFVCSVTSYTCAGVEPVVCQVPSVHASVDAIDG